MILSEKSATFRDHALGFQRIGGLDDVRAAADRRARGVKHEAADGEGLGIDPALTLQILSDRIGPRNLLTGMRIIYGVLATTVMILAFTGSLNPVRTMP